MSYQLVDKVLMSKVGNASAKSVLIALAKFANTENKCFPSYQTLANMTELSIATIKRAVKFLNEKGYIKVVNRYLNQKPKHNATNLFFICSSKFEALEIQGVHHEPTPIHGELGVVSQRATNQSINLSINSVHTVEHHFVEANEMVASKPQIEYLVSDEDKNKPVQSNPSSLKENYQAYFKQKETKIELIKKELIQLDVNAHEAETFAKRLIESNKFKRGFQTALDNLIANIKAGVNKEISANRIVVVANERNWHDYQASWGVYPERSNHAKSYKDYDPSAHAKQDPDYYTNANFAHVKVVGGNGKLFDR